MARTVRQSIPKAPAAYDQEHAAQTAEALNRYMTQREALGEVTAGRFILVDPLHIPPDPPTTQGLPTGLLYLKQTPAVATASVDAASVPSTSSTTWVMAGLHLQFTPAISTKAQFTIEGQVGNTVNNGETDLSLVYGVGSPPAFGVAVPAGAQILGQPVRFVATSGGGTFGPFSRTALITGLTVGATYWVDIAIRVTAGSSLLTEAGITGFGMFGYTGYFLTVVEPGDSQ